MNLMQIVNEIISMKVKAVSFDLFDTLICRPVISPQDLFYLIGLKTKYGKNFYHMRINSEQCAAKDKEIQLETITLPEIYKKMQFLYGVSESEAELLKELELETEIKYILPRVTMTELLRSLADKGKRVVITTDTYLSLSFIENILEKNNIVGYEKVFVSCEYGKCKRSGNLYREVIEHFKEENIYPNEIIHIGDNRAVDIQMAQKQGIQAYYVPSAINRMKSIHRLDVITKSIDSHLDNSFLVGYIANLLFDNPLCEFNRETIADGKWENAADLMIAPILFSFCKWMLEDCINNKVEKIFFVYRDGYIPEKLVGLLQKVYGTVLQAENLYINRSMLYCFYGEKENGLFHAYKDIPFDANMSIEDFIKNRILVDETDGEEIQNVFDILKKYGANKITDPVKDIDFNGTPVWMDLEAVFRKNAVKASKAMDFYINGLLKNERNYAVFDIGYRGRVGKVLKNRYGGKFIGYHLCAKSELQMANNQGAQTKALIQRGLDVLKNAPLCYILLDDIVSVQNPGMSKVTMKNDSLNFVYERDQEFSEEIELIQGKIIDFVRGIIDLFGKDIPLLNFDIFPFFALYTDFLSDNISRKDVELFRKMRSPNEAGIISMKDTDYYRNWYKQIVSKYEEAKKQSLKEQQKEEISLSFRESFYLKLLNSRVRKILQLYYKTVRKLLEKMKVKETISEYAFEQIFDLHDIFKNQAQLSLERMIDIAEQEQLLDGVPVVAVFGEIIENKGLGECIKRWDGLNKRNRIIYFRESVEKDLLPCTVCEVPKFLFRNSILNYREYPVKVSGAVRRKVKENRYLQDAYENLSNKFDMVPKEYMLLYVYWADWYIAEVLDYLKLKSVIVWLEFYPYHEIIVENCRKKNIKVLFWEFGVLPGTYCLESDGQMGESGPAVNYSEVREKKVSKFEIQAAKEVIRYIKNENLIRWNDGDTQAIYDVLSQLKKDRPVILYAGQNDYESGMYPYNEKARKYHSPVFSSSDEAAIYLAGLAEKHDWNLIYKPHPAMIKAGKLMKQVPKNLLVLKGGDINTILDEADLAVTILSQCAYVSLLRGKPVVMLGYTQLRGKGCTYEAFQKEDVETVILKALKEGYSKKMHQEFMAHAAWVLKYYVYDDGTHPEFPYGLPDIRALGMFENDKWEEDPKQVVAGFLKRREKGKEIWERLLAQHHLEPKAYVFLLFPTFDKSLNESALKCIDIIFPPGTRIIILANDKVVLKKASEYSTCVKKTIYASKFQCECLMEYYNTEKITEELYVIALDEPKGRCASHMTGVKGTSLDELVVGGIFDRNYEEYELPGSES